VDKIAALIASCKHLFYFTGIELAFSVKVNTEAPDEIFY
jgi:hypothetical protein